MQTRSCEAIAAGLDQRFKHLQFLSTDDKRAVLDQVKAFVASCADQAKMSDDSLGPSGKRKSAVNEQPDQPAAKRPPVLRRLAGKGCGSIQSSDPLATVPMPEQRSVEQQFEQYQYMVGCGINKDS